MAKRKTIIIALVITILVVALVGGGVVWLNRWISGMRQMGPVCSGDLAYDIEHSGSDHAMDIIGGLGHEGPAAAYAVPVLIDLIKKKHIRAGNAATALGKIGAVSEDVIPALIEALESDDWSMRVRVAEALGRIGPMAIEASDALTRLLRDKDDDVQLAAAYALVDIGVHDKAAVPIILKTVNESGLPGDRHKAAIYLGRMGPAAKAVLPDFLELSEYKDRHLRLAVKSAIVTIRGEDTKSCIDEVVSYIKKGEGGFVIGILAMFGYEASSTVPLLFETLKVPEDKYFTSAKTEIVRVLPKIYPDTEQLITMLISCFEYCDSTPVRLALEGLCPQAVPALEKALNSKDARVHDGAKETLLGFKLKSKVRRAQLARQTASRPVK